MAETILTPDLCVLGGGDAAAPIAVQAALAGLRTVLLRGAEAGRAPPPYRQVHAFAAAAAAAADLRRAARFGLEVPEVPVDFARVRQGVQAALADLALDESDARLKALGVGVIAAGGRFMDPTTVAAGGFEIRARRFLLVPSFVPVVPRMRGLPKTAHLTAERLIELRELPRHLVVIGAGAAGLSVAQSFRRFGADVTVLEAASPLQGEDRECTQLLLDALAREGVAVHAGVEVRGVEGKRGALRAAFAQGGRERALDASHLLLACGWRAELDNLGLELAGIDAGKLKASGDVRTGNGRVFVAANGPGSPQADAWHARLVISNLLLRTPLGADPSYVARATATDPALAHVGLTEDEARERHRDIRILRRPFAGNEAAALAGESRGMAKLIATRGGRLLGATIVGRGAAEQIGSCALAVSRRLGLHVLADPLFPPSSRAEIAQQAALSGLGGGLTSPWLRRIIAALRLLD